MTQPELILAAATGAICLAICATLWALAQRRRAEASLDVLRARLAEAERRVEGAQSSAEAFDSAMIAVEQGVARLASGEESLAACAAALGAPGADAQALVTALMRGDPDHARRLRALFERGEPCAFEAAGQGRHVAVEGRTAGAIAWLRVTAVAGSDPGLPSVARFAAFLDVRDEPAWIAAADGSPVWANQAWLKAVGAATVEEAAARGLTFDREADALASEAANLGEPRQALRWSAVEGRRRAFRVYAEPLDGGGVGVTARDVTEAETLAETFKRHVSAHDQTLNQISEAVAVFGEGRRLTFWNTAFAKLWGLEPAWLAEHPTHGEVLDRLRQRRRLPESVDYASWKAQELAYHEALEPQPEELWSLPDGRTLSVTRQPHPLGGLLILFSDITGELRLKAQYNALIQVQQATLDKLSDAVAVFGSDTRLRLYNEAFRRFWTAAEEDVAGADFDSVVEVCLPRIHDRQFWRDLKGRVAGLDPEMRAEASGELRTSDRRIIAWRSRPLPDGATLVAFSDVTDTRRLEGALADRETALAESDRLKRRFVENVSYELRTPLTTIIGYSELLERAGEGLSERGRGHVAAVRAAAAQLSRSIDDVLDVAEIDAQEMALDLADVDVGRLLASAATRWRTEAEEGGVEIQIDPAADVGLIRADLRRLAQVMDHLVENAISQTPRGGHVTLSAKRAQGEVRLQVSDTGRGIPFHVQAHIFDRFVDRDRGGPGLGLALVKALVELHGGWVALESEPGAGATFTCHLPEVAEGVGAPELF